MTVVRKCDSHQGDVKCIRKVCQFIERCDDNGGDVKVLGEVLHLSESVTAIGEE